MCKSVAGLTEKVKKQKKNKFKAGSLWEIEADVFIFWLWKSREEFSCSCLEISDVNIQFSFFHTDISHHTT